MKRKYFKNNTSYFSFLDKWKSKIKITKLYFTNSNKICIVYSYVM